MLQHPKQKKITLRRITTPRRSLGKVFASAFTRSGIKRRKLRFTGYGSCGRELQAWRYGLTAWRRSLLLPLGLAQGF